MECLLNGDEHGVCSLVRIYSESLVTVSSNLIDLVADLYLNGTLYKSRFLSYIPIITDKGTLTIKKNGGFKGSISNFSYFNYAISETDILKFYNWGSG